MQLPRTLSQSLRKKRFDKRGKFPGKLYWDCLKGETIPVGQRKFLKILFDSISIYSRMAIGTAIKSYAKNQNEFLVILATKILREPDIVNTISQIAIF